MQMVFYSRSFFLLQGLLCFAVAAPVEWNKLPQTVRS